MSSKNIVFDIIKKIEKGEEISPFLFLWNNKELLNTEVKSIGLDLLKELDIPSNYLYFLEDDWTNIKTAEIKLFLTPSNLTPPYKIQIFLIENISRMTLGAANSCLKAFEEPWKRNIIFLTNTSESMVLDTILSRVQIQKIWWSPLSKNSEFYLSMISSYITSDSPEIISYFFRNKLEKEDYLSFLENLIIYSKNNMVFIEFLDEISDDINMIWSNNVNAKWIVDKWLIKIK